jgi:magnesium transporter
MLRIYDLLEAVRDGIVAARDSHLTALSNRVNASMRTLTAVATILLPLSFVAGVFGMNFDVIPFSHSPYGFWFAMGVMGVLALILYVLFRRRAWL